MHCAILPAVTLAASFGDVLHHVVGILLCLAGLSTGLMCLLQGFVVALHGREVTAVPLMRTRVPGV